MTALPPDRKDSAIKDSSLEDAALRPRPVFLLCAALTAGGVVAAYMHEDAIVEKSGDMAFVVLLAILTMISLLFVLFYRIPRIGNRLLGHSAVLDAGERERAGAASHFTGPYRIETGLHEKRQATARKTARATRKAVAATTRAMQQERLARRDKDEADE